MMIALALDTSGPSGSVALVREGDDGAREVLADAVIERGMRHGVELFPTLERVLAGAEVKPREVDVVAVGTGPGSYTGLRVGITAARALAYAAGSELFGVPSCDAWAAATPPTDRPLAVVLDARVRAVYLATYEPLAAPDPDAPLTHWRRAAGPELMPAPAAAASLPANALVVGDAREAYAPSFDAFEHASLPQRADAASVARLALARRSLGERDRIDAVKPLYLNPPYRRDVAPRSADRG